MATRCCSSRLADTSSLQPSSRDCARTVASRWASDCARHARTVTSRNNPALYDLLEEQAGLERRIAILEGQLAAAEIVVPAADGAASIGSLVRVCDRKAGDLAEYELVGPIEADIANARVSVEAPVGRALVGQGAGAVVDVETPKGTLGLEILSVRTPKPRPWAREAA